MGCMINILTALYSYSEKDASVLGTVEHPVSILGFCAGEIPGAVAVMANNVQELAGIMVEVVRVLFRFWQEMKTRTITVDEGDGNWGVTVMGASQEYVQAILDDFHDCEVTMCISMRTEPLN